MLINNTSCWYSDSIVLLFQLQEGSHPDNTQMLRCKRVFPYNQISLRTLGIDQRTEKTPITQPRVA